ncbi:MAG: uracil-DNA glycosylase [Candidatus Latescibacteria bacterium 4484_181]|nr:MAG: uracil-DNA glycosylase [Candidatus Latescibacteria bacterium 4484_181]RKY67764.1 MAG: uracil-DNA glycosylase [Candidatus Latescibacterota bacterium]
MEIDELNKMIKGCKKCRLSETRINALCGEGNLNAKIMLIAQAPGEKEDKEGKMFVGPSGKVLDELLSTAGIARQETYMTNLVKCMLPKYRKPKQDEIEACSYYLDEEIKLINPEILAPLGYYATAHIFQRYGILSLSRAEFSSIYGRLFWAKDKKILPLPHPASLLHNPDLRQDLTKGYGKLRVLLIDCKWYPVCPMKRFYEKGKLDKKWIELYCKGDWESCVRYQMEEEGKPHPDWMLPDGTLDEKLQRQSEK